MPVVVLFIIFVVLLVIAVPVSITLGITSVLPSVFDPSFTVGAKYLIRAKRRYEEKNRGTGSYDSVYRHCFS